MASRERKRPEDIFLRSFTLPAHLLPDHLVAYWEVTWRLAASRSLRRRARHLQHSPACHPYQRLQCSGLLHHVRRDGGSLRARLRRLRLAANESLESVLVDHSPIS